MRAGEGVSTHQKFVYSCLQLTDVSCHFRLLKALICFFSEVERWMLHAIGSFIIPHREKEILYVHNKGYLDSK